MSASEVESSLDVLIVGAGVAGLSLATALGSQGFKVRVIDGAPRPERPAAGREMGDWDLRVSALTPASISFLAELGAWQGIPANRTGRYHCMQIWDAQGTGSIRFDAEEVQAPFLGHIVENRLTLQALLQCADHCAGVEVAWGQGLESMKHTEAGWEIACSTGHRYCAPLTVGADGARSRVRELTAMPTRQWSYHQKAIVGTMVLGSGHLNTCWQAFLDTGPLALLPLADPEKVAIVWSLDEAEHGRIADLPDEAFLRALNHALGQDGPTVAALGPRASFPLRQAHAVKYIDQGLVLVADAAHSIHPLAGQGINLGLSDVRALAGELVSGKACGLLVSDPVLLKRYQRQRKTENLAMMAAMEAFKRGFGSQNPVAVLARNIGLNVVDQTSWMKRWFMEQALS